MLDKGEAIIKGDEILTCVNKWRMFEDEWVGERLSSPIRREDDGKGKYVLIDKPVDPEDMEDVEFWRWGVGWVWGGCALRKDEAYATLIWRKPRGMEKPETQPQEAEKEKLWLSLSQKSKHLQRWGTKKEAEDYAKNQAMGSADAEIYYTGYLAKAFQRKMTVNETML